MAKVIIEIYDEHGHRQDYRMIDSQIVTIGRAYSNDVIVYDPFVSAEHVRINLADEGWIVEDRFSENGTRVNQHNLKGQSASIQSGDKIIIGQSHIRIFSAYHAIDPTLILERGNRLTQNLNKKWYAFLMMTLMLAYYSVMTYLGTFKNQPLEKVVAGPVGLTLGIVVWVAIWSFVARIIKHKSYFIAQLGLTFTLLLCATIVVDIADIVIYSTNCQVLDMALSAVIWCVSFAILLRGHFEIATFISRKKQLFIASIISIGLFSFLTLSFFAVREEFEPQPSFYKALKAPFFRWAPSHSVDTFVDDTHMVYDALDQEIKKKK